MWRNRPLALGHAGLGLPMGLQIPMWLGYGQGWGTDEVHLARGRVWPRGRVWHGDGLVRGGTGRSGAGQDGTVWCGAGTGQDGGMDHRNLLGEPPATYLLPDPSADQLAAGADPATVAAADPGCLAAWAALAEAALERQDWVTAYAFARTGYHRGLDQLRRAGWKGHGPIPWEHEPNRGFLRSLHALGRAAGAIGEVDEEQRCAEFLQDSSSSAVAALAGS